MASHFADGIFECYFMTKMRSSLIKESLKFVLGPRWQIATTGSGEGLLLHIHNPFTCYNVNLDLWHNMAL